MKMKMTLLTQNLEHLYQYCYSRTNFWWIILFPFQKTSKDDSPQKKLFQEFINANKEETDNYKDSDNEEDYYWDEETA